MRYTKAFFLFALLFYTGCKTPTDSVQSQDPFSLQQSWIYSDQNFDINGPTGVSTTDSIYIVSSALNKGKTNYSLSDNTVLVIDSNSQMTGVVQTDCICDIEKMPATGRDTVVRHDNIPLKVGGKVVSNGSLVLFVRNPDTTITVPAGTFRCAAYELEILINNIPSGAYNVSFISPALGLIQYDVYDIDGTTNKSFLARRKQLLRTIK